MLNKSAPKLINFNSILITISIFFLFIFGLLISCNIFLAVMTLVFLISIAIFIAKPQLTLFLFGCFLLFQPLLTNILKLQIVQNLDEAAILTFFLVMIIKKIMHREPFIPTHIDIPLLCVVTIGMLGTILNKIVPLSVSLGGLLLFIKGFLLFYIFANSSFEEKHVKFFMKGFLFIGLFLAIYGILGLFLPRIFLISLGIIPVSDRLGIEAAQSLLGHPGAFAAFMAILASYTLSAGLIKKNNKKFIMLSIFFLVCIILSLRRTSLFGFFLAFMVISFVELPLEIENIKIKKNISAILFGVLVVFSSFIISMYNDLIHNYVLRRDSPRSILFKTGLKIVKDYFPFGSGFGTFSGGINQTAYSPLYYKYGLNRIWGLSPEKSSFINDTFWPHIFAETGIFGLFFYLLIIVGLFRICVKAFLFADKSTILKIFTLGVFMTLVISLVESTKATFYEMSLWTYFYFGSIGILSAFIKKESLIIKCKY